MSQDNFRVIVAGGGVAGLALAKMLEIFGIDYIVLEAYSNLVPQAGASIGLTANSLRILDQLGCYEDVKNLVVRPVNTVVVTQGSSGRTVVQFDDLETHSVERHGYPICFLDRQMLLNLLYQRIEDKSKIVPSKKVMKVELLESGVKVLTTDGCTYTGDILIGADGVHSKIRTEMWRIANSVIPGYVSESETTAMPCDYSCLFGISSLVPDLDVQSGKMYRGWNESYTYIVASGPTDRVYWFIFSKLKKTYHAPNIPTYTKQDEEKLVQKCLNDKITKDVTFGDIYKCAKISVMTALPTYVFRQWHFGRIMTIGDAAHKFMPISGQGGSAAMESAAAVVNGLVEARSLHGSNPDDEAISRLFERVQQIRYSRVSNVVVDSYKQQQVEAMETPLMKFIALYVAPRLTNSFPLGKLDAAVSPAVKLDALPVPNQPRFLPYEDELLSKPQNRGYLNSASTSCCFLFLAYFGYKVLMQSRMPVSIDLSALNENLTDHKPLIYPRQIHIGISFFDQKLAVLVSRLAPAASNVDPVQRLQCAYFLVSLAPIFGIWYIESYRERNSRSLLMMPIIWIAFAQTWGVGAVLPWYYLTWFYQSRNPTYYRQVSRAVPLHVAKCALPGVIIGYLVPTILMFFGFHNPESHQNWIALWLLTPLSPFITAQIWPKFFGKTLEKGASGKHLLIVYENLDLPYLKQLHSVLFFALTALHLSAITVCAFQESFSFKDAFLPLSFPKSGGPSFQGEPFFLQYSLIIYALSSLLWAIFSVQDLRRVGLSDLSNVKLSVALVALLLIAGPGAMISAISYWREVTMTSMSKAGQRTLDGETVLEEHKTESPLGRAGRI